MTFEKRPLSEKQVKRLVKMGEHYGPLYKVTPDSIDGVLEVHIRDFVFKDFVSAALFIQSAEAAENPANFTEMIG